MSRPHRNSGFTLIEAAVATVVIGLGVVALMHCLGAGTRVNAEGREITQAVFLAQEIREWTLRLPFSDPDPGDAHRPPGPDAPNSPSVVVDDLDDLMNYTFCPPRNGMGGPITTMADWSQQVLFEWRDPDNLSLTVPPPTDCSLGTGVINITVVIRRGDREVLRTSWLAVRRPE